MCENLISEVMRHKNCRRDLICLISHIRQVDLRNTIIMLVVITEIVMIMIVILMIITIGILITSIRILIKEIYIFVIVNNSVVSYNT